MLKPKRMSLNQCRQPADGGDAAVAEDQIKVLDRCG
jgi:hypothetical protein